MASEQPGVFLAWHCWCWLWLRERLLPSRSPGFISLLPGHFELCDTLADFLPQSLSVESQRLLLMLVNVAFRHCLLQWIAESSL